MSIVTPGRLAREKAQQHYSHGHFSLAEPHARRAVELLGQEGLVQEQVLQLSQLSAILYGMGKGADEIMPIVDRAVSLAQGCTDEALLAHTLHNKGVVLLELKMDFPEAIAALERAAEISKRLGNNIAVAISTVLKGKALESDQPYAAADAYLSALPTLRDALAKKQLRDSSLFAMAYGYLDTTGKLPETGPVSRASMEEDYKALPW